MVEVHHAAIMEATFVDKTVLNDERFAILLLLYTKGGTGRLNEPVEGITRLQKLMFLLGKEKVVSQIGKLQFEAYAFGPYRPQLYDQIAYLKNMRLIQDANSSRSDKDADDSGIFAMAEELGSGSVPVRSSTEFEQEEISFDYLMEGVAESLPERYQTEKYCLSQSGMNEVEKRLERFSIDPNLPKLLRTIVEIKTRFNQIPLKTLIRYVYEKYPDSAENSIIANQLGF